MSMQLETIGEELRSALATDAVDYTAMRARSLAGAFFFDRDGRVSGCVVLVNHRAQACALRSALRLNAVRAGVRFAPRANRHCAS
jgi:hypothetical protein